MKKQKIYETFSRMPTLHTERLILRPMHVTDANDMFEYAQRSDVTEYLLWSPHPSITYSRDYLAYIESRYAKCDFYDWSITLASNGKMIGTAGFTRIDSTHNCAEIGYVLNPNYHRMGYGKEAAGCIVRFGFEKLSLHRIEAKFMQGNEASLALMKSIGMTFEGYARESMLVKGRYRTIGTCAILRSDFDENNNNG